jgi:hypothetical protein
MPWTLEFLPGDSSSTDELQFISRHPDVSRVGLGPTLYQYAVHFVDETGQTTDAVLLRIRDARQVQAVEPVRNQGAAENFRRIYGGLSHPSTCEDTEKPWPDWVKPGQWAYNRKADSYVEILGFNKAKPWRGLEVKIWRMIPSNCWCDNVDEFITYYEPCEKPEDPPTAWSRLVKDDPE